MKIVHISDLHFGRENSSAVSALLDTINQLKPSVVVISGDLTQRARRKQFKAAANFIEQIHFPKVIVPGNHDIPLYDIPRRLLIPFHRYIKYINADFYPTYLDDRVCIIGINTAYAFTWKSGRISQTQLNYVAEKFGLAGDVIKILVIHHPYHEIFYQAKYQHFLETIPVDLVLSGHLHKSFARIQDQLTTQAAGNILLVQAGTAVSNRLREACNSFNTIEVVNTGQLEIVIWQYQDEKFHEGSRFQFCKANESWQQTT